MVWPRQLFACAAAWAVAGVPAFAQSTPDVIGDAVSFGSRVSAPDYYTVQPGDTLWDISSRFLGNAYYWPRLWSINDYVTNPHWIYPGNRIVFRMGTELDPPDFGIEGLDRLPSAAPAIEAVASECGPDVRFDMVRPLRSYIAPGFIADKDDVEIYGDVRKARGEQTLLSTRDLLYLRVDDPEAFGCGDVVSVFRRTRKKVRHPRSRGQRFGSAYRVVAEATVVHRHDDYLTAQIRRSWSEVHRGDYVGPAVPVAVEIEVQAPQGDLDGTIIDRVESEQGLMGPGETVFVDRGRVDGVRVGNSFYVVEQRDPHLDVKKEDEELPFSVIGRVVVVRVDEYSSTAVVTDANRSISIGHRLKQRVE
jgi:hypothetical protein